MLSTGVPRPSNCPWWSESSHWLLPPPEPPHLASPTCCRLSLLNSCWANFPSPSDSHWDLYRPLQSLACISFLPTGLPATANRTSCQGLHGLPRTLESGVPCLCSNDSKSASPHTCIPVSRPLPPCPLCLESASCEEFWKGPRAAPLPVSLLGPPARQALDVVPFFLWTYLHAVLPPSVHKPISPQIWELLRDRFRVTFTHSALSTGSGTVFYMNSWSFKFLKFILKFPEYICIGNSRIQGVCELSHVQLFAAPWTVAHQAPLSMGFFKQEYWSRLPFPSPGDLPDPGIEPAYFASPVMASGFLTTSTTWEAQ